MTKYTDIFLKFKLVKFFHFRQDILNLLQPFWTFGCRRSYCFFFQKKGDFSTVCTKQTQKFWDKKFTNYVTRLDTRIIWQFLRAEADSALRNTWPQLAPQYQNWQRKYMDVATNCIWAITSSPQTLVRVDERHLVEFQFYISDFMTYTI